MGVDDNGNIFSLFKTLSVAIDDKRLCATDDVLYNTCVYWGAPSIKVRVRVRVGRTTCR